MPPHFVYDRMTARLTPQIRIFFTVVISLEKRRKVTILVLFEALFSLIRKIKKKVIYMLKTRETILLYGNLSFFNGF